MRIVFVVDQYDSGNNGTTISARRFAKALVERGNEVRIISTGKPSDYKYRVRQLYLLPLGENIVKSQGMAFGLPQKRTFESACEWADVVHFMMPFALSRGGKKYCDKAGVPTTAAFHVQPENISSTLGLGNNQKFNEFLYNSFRQKFFNDFTHIHCPTEFIANELIKRDYTARLHIISNGVDPAFSYRREKKVKELEGKIPIMMIGRYSVEKRQDVLIEAVKQSKYSDKIQLILAGQGPLKAKIEKQGKDLYNPPIMKFFDGDDLRHYIAMSDLYVHPADVEIEAIACIESFSMGLVPVIANSPKSATKAFALDKRSLFQAGNPSDLAKKIDYWLDNAVERENMGKKYAEYGKKFSLNKSAEKFEEMCRMVINEANR